VRALRSTLIPDGQELAGVNVAFVFINLYPGIVENEIVLVLVVLVPVARELAAVITFLLFLRLPGKIGRQRDSGSGAGRI
jgi:hypothetical protein